MDSGQRGRLAFTFAMLGLAAGLAAAWHFDAWAMIWGTQNPIPPGRYPSIILLALFALAWVIPPLLGMAAGAVIFGTIGYVIAPLVFGNRT